MSDKSFLQLLPKYTRYQIPKKTYRCMNSAQKKLTNIFSKSTTCNNFIFNTGNQLKYSMLHLSACNFKLLDKKKQIYRRNEWKQNITSSISYGGTRKCDIIASQKSQLYNSASSTRNNITPTDHSKQILNPLA
jgi:hypothetical protein